jgi:hypothetical protein
MLAIDAALDDVLDGRDLTHIGHIDSLNPGHDHGQRFSFLNQRPSQKSSKSNQSHYNGPKSREESRR